MKTSALTVSIMFGNAGHEGRLGMAAVTVKEADQFDGSKMYNHVVAYLPSYARPRFIRIQVIFITRTHAHTMFCSHATLSTFSHC